MGIKIFKEPGSADSCKVVPERLAYMATLVQILQEIGEPTTWQMQNLWGWIVPGTFREEQWGLRAQEEGSGRVLT